MLWWCVLKTFTKFTGKHLCQNRICHLCIVLFTFAGLKSVTLLKRDSNTGVFCEFLEIRTPLSWTHPVTATAGNTIEIGNHWPNIRTWTLSYLAKLDKRLSCVVSTYLYESRCSHLNFRFHACFEQVVPLHSDNYRVWIHSDTRKWLTW